MQFNTEGAVSSAWGTQNPLLLMLSLLRVRHMGISSLKLATLKIFYHGSQQHDK